MAGLAALGNPVLAAAADKAAKKGDANDTLHVAVVGVHGRGMSHVGGFPNKNLNTVITHVCDADTAVIGKAMKTVEEAQKAGPEVRAGLPQALDDKSIDIISIATPNHWHALAAIWAMQAGKHVYVEKPVSHNVSEGRRIVEAARKYDRICQAGTQSRSMTGMREAIAFVHAGGIGKVKRGPRPVLQAARQHRQGRTAAAADPEDRRLRPLVRPGRRTSAAACSKKPALRLALDLGLRQRRPRQPGHPPDGHRPLGPGQERAGEVGAQRRRPLRLHRRRPDAPTRRSAVFDYGDAELIFEVRGLSTKDLLGAKVGNIFYGSDGYLVCPSYDSGIVYDKDGKKVKEFTTPKELRQRRVHFGNFVKAVRSGKSTDLNGDILEGHLSSALCHLGNISYRLGSEQPFSKKTKAFGDDKEAAETLERTAEHLKDNSVPLDETNYRVGRRLTLDPKKETFVGDKEADAMLTREYRKGFVVPEKV